MIKEINIADIKEYIKEAQNYGLLFSNKTNLYALYIENKIVGFTGIIFYKEKAIFKNHYILKEHRGNGYFKQLLDFSLKKTKDKKIIEATCTSMSINEYLKRGFKIIQTYRLYKKVRYENL
jgi:predicted acetyltransferase